MINVMAEVRLWAHLWSGHSLLILCDNAAAVSVLQTGRGRDHIPFHCARIMWRNSAAYDFRITVDHILGTDNNLADFLSRYHTHPTHKETGDNLVFKHQLHICSVNNSIFSLNPDAFSYVTDDITYLLRTAQKRTKHAFRPGTTANQRSQIERYLTFCFTYNVNHLSPSVNTVLVYIKHLAQSLSLHKSVMNYLSAIKHLHRLSGAEFTAFNAYPVSLLIRALPLTMTS